MMSSESDCWFLDLPTGILHYICVLLLANNGERDLLSLVATCDYLRDTISQFHLGVSVEFSVLCPSYDTPKSLEFDKLNTFLKPSSNWYIKTLTLICDPLAPEWIWYGRGPELKLNFLMILNRLSTRGSSKLVIFIWSSEKALDAKLQIGSSLFFLISASLLRKFISICLK